MTRNYGRAPRGQRVNEATPQGRWQILTMLAALTARGLEAPMTIAEATDGDISWLIWSRSCVLGFAPARW